MIGRASQNYRTLTTNAVELTMRQYPNKIGVTGFTSAPTGTTLYMQFADAGSLGWL